MKLHTAAACVAALFLASAVFSHTVALRLLLLAIGIVLASIVVAKDKQVRALPPIWIPFVLWGAWALLSLAWSLEPERTLKEWKNEVFYTGAALWICYVGAQARAAARIFAAVVGIAASVACLLALRDFLVDWERYAQGWHGGPGDHSSAILVLMPGVATTAWLALVRRLPAWIAPASFALAALLLASAYTTLNKTVWLGLMVEAAVLGALLLRRKRTAGDARLSKAAKLAAWGAAVAVLAAGSALLLHVHAQRESMVDPASVNRDSRIEVWREAAQLAARRPLLGDGFGRGLLREELQGRLQGAANLWHAHNYFLDLVLQVGVPGLLLMLVLIAAILRQGLESARHPDPMIAACGIVLIGVVAGMVVRNITDTLLVRQNALLFWGAVGALLALGSRGRAPSA